MTKSFGESIVFSLILVIIDFTPDWKKKKLLCPNFEKLWYYPEFRRIAVLLQNSKNYNLPLIFKLYNLNCGKPCTNLILIDWVDATGYGLR